jgi:hypothetical protein
MRRIHNEDAVSPELIYTIKLVNPAHKRGFHSGKSKSLVTVQKFISSQRI